MPFGIPQEALPFTASGEIKLDSLKKFIEERRFIEQQRKQEEIASGDVYPKPNDVLLGRGRYVRTFSSSYSYAEGVPLTIPYTSPFTIIKTRPRIFWESTTKIYDRSLSCRI